MKIKLITILFVLAFVSLVPAFTQAQDANTPDTLIIMTSRPEAGGDDSTFVIELWAWHDAQDINIAVGFSWDFDGLTLDSAKASAEAVTLYGGFIFLFDGNISNSNTNNQAAFGAFNFGGTGFSPKANRYLVATYYYTISPKWQVADEILVDTSAYDDSADLFFLDPLAVADDWIPVYFHGNTDISVKDPSDVNDANGLPAAYSLGQNYPNPFNPSTTVNFSLEKAGQYTFTVYNVIGQVVYEETKNGQVGNNQTQWNGSGQASGVYFYKLRSGDFTETKKMMLVK